MSLFSTIGYTLNNDKAYNDIIEEFAENLHSSKYLNSTIAKSYKDNLLKAVSSVFGDDDTDLSKQLKDNITAFAHYKAYNLTQIIHGIKKSYPDKDFKTISKVAINTFNRYQAAEYNTAVARCRTAKQWQAMTGDKYNNILFPNIKWLPSRSAHPREAHIKFYNRIWAKNDPFWQSNTPGSLWNCKCDWQQTSSPVTESNPIGSISAPGLKGNPGVTGKVFSDDASYFNIPHAEKTQVNKFISSYIKATSFSSVHTDNNKIIKSDAVKSSSSDYKDILASAEYFAKTLHIQVVILPKVHAESIAYAELYEDAPRQGKCPDLKIGEYFYAVEGSIGNNPIRNFADMMRHAVSQSNRIIIKDCGLTDSYMLRSIKGRIKKGADIKEVWILRTSGQLDRLI